MNDEISMTAFVIDIGNIDMRCTQNPVFDYERTNGRDDGTMSPITAFVTGSIFAVVIPRDVVAQLDKSDRYGFISQTDHKRAIVPRGTRHITATTDVCASMSYCIGLIKERTDIL